MNSIKKLVLPIAVAAITLGTTNAFGQFLHLIPTLGSDTDNSARAISPDGAYVVGQSITSSQGFFYDVFNNTVTLPIGGGAAPSILTGIGYRDDGGQPQIILDGLSAGYQANWMTADGGATWGQKRRDTTGAWNTLPAANSLGSAAAGGDFYTTSRNSTSLAVYVNQGTGLWDGATAPTYNTTLKNIPSPDTSAMNGISANGRAVGMRRISGDGNRRQNYVLTWNGPGTTPLNFFFNGLAGNTEGEAFSVSADGTVIFGRSPIVDNGTDVHGYKSTFDSTFPGTPAQLTLDALPELPGTTGASRQAPYGCTADGKYAVGMDYTGVETAVLWDTSSPFGPADWTVTDLFDFATTHGLADGWISLNRAYSVGDTGNGLMVTGQGVWSPDGGTTLYTRAFVMLVPEPNAIWMLLTGLGLLVGRGLWMRKRV